MNSELDHLYIRKVLEGDKEAFRYFINMYQEMCFSIALPMVKDKSDARDVVQNAFIKAYKGLAAFNQKAKFSTWIYRIVVNEALMQIRKKRRTFKEDLELEFKPIELQTSNNTIDKLHLKEKRAQIKLALERMKPKEALMLQLFYLKEHSIREIEEITGFSAGNIKVLLHRARNSFSQIFNFKEYGR